MKTQDPQPLFRSLGALRALNVLGVGLSMAASVGALGGARSGCDEFSNPAAFCAALPTLVMGTAWAWVLRWEKPLVRLGGLRAGWVLSVPLAMLASSLRAGFDAAYGQGFVAGLRESLLCLPWAATFGLLFHAPARVAVALAFGGPLWWAQRQGRRGLVGEERGERGVGLVVVLLSVLGLLFASYRFPSGEQTWLDDRRNRFGCGFEEATHVDSPAWRLPDSDATTLLTVLGLLGMMAGVAAASLA